MVKTKTPPIQWVEIPFESELGKQVLAEIEQLKDELDFTCNTIYQHSNGRIAAYTYADAISFSDDAVIALHFIEENGKLILDEESGSYSKPGVTTVYSVVDDYIERAAF